MSEWTQINGADGAFKAYVAKPAGAPRGAVVVVQEIFGVNAVTRGKADWMAREGYLAIAPDLFWRNKPGVNLTDQTEAEWQEGIAQMNALDKGDGARDVAAAIAYARAQGCAKVGVMGYCMGGLIAYLAACRSDADATVAYHGGGIHMLLDEAKNIKKPIMMHHPMKDKFIPVDALNTIRETLKDNPLVTIHEYAEQDHAFTREGGKEYDAEATKLADARTVAFFRAHIG